ncbi:MAG: hypothetical protein AAF222_10300 [Pseudomonadota bacterium]
MRDFAAVRVLNLNDRFAHRAMSLMAPKTTPGHSLKAQERGALKPVLQNEHMAVAKVLNTVFTRSTCQIPFRFPAGV